MNQTNEFIYILTYFHANMEKLNTLRDFTISNNSSINLIGQKKINEYKKTNKNLYNKLKYLIYGKCIIITTNKKIQEQIIFFNNLKQTINDLNIYINCVLINNIYYTIPNITYLYNLISKLNYNNLLFPYSFIYFLQVLTTKSKQLNEKVYLTTNSNNVLLFKNLIINKLI